MTEPRLRVRRSIHIPTMWSAGDDESCGCAGGGDRAGGGLGATSKGAFYMLPADKKIFRLVRKLLWAAEVQRRLPAALRRRKEWAVAEDGAEGGGLEEEAEAEGAQWLGMWPILDPSALGARRADSDAPRWQAVVAASSHGASGGEGTRRRPSAMGLRFMLRSGVPLRRRGRRRRRRRRSGAAGRWRSRTPVNSSGTRLTLTLDGGPMGHSAR